MDASDRRRRASEEAATWWVRLRTEELARADRELFVDWLRESAVHVAEMLRVAKVHNALEEFQGWMQIADGPDDQGDDENVVSLPHPSPASSLDSPPSFSDWQIRGRDESFPGTTRRRLWSGAIAAGLATVAILAMLLFPLLRGQTIQTERGERREVALADGSILEVDPQTRLRVAFEEHTRRVFLEKGRALFRVAKNPERPFLVQAGGTTVRAVGTAFGVEHRKQGVIVTVAEGKVGVYVREVSTPRSQLPSPADGEGHQESSPSIPLQHLQRQGPAQKAGEASDGEGAQRAGEASPAASTLFLTANQQVTVQPSGTAALVRKVNSDRELAWAKGQLVFDNESVADAVDEFNRYNRVQLHVRDEALAARPVSGVFDASDPESFIGFLQTMTSVRVMRGESEIIMQ
jgi:transmembrane sensor